MFESCLLLYALLQCRDAKKLPFFLYIYVDKDLVVGRGRAGGLAVWARAHPDWEAKAGVLQVYK